MNLSTFIANTPFFSGLQPTCCQLIAKHTTLHHYSKQCMLFAEGREGSYVYILASGMIKLSKMTEEGAESVVGIIQPGRCLPKLFYMNATRIR